MRIPFPLMVDAYQASHFNQIPPGMENFQCSHITHRKSIKDGDHRIVSAGIFPFVQWLKEVRVTDDDIKEADEFYSTFCASIKEPYYKPYPWPKDMFQTIVNKYNGQIPITVQALIDGSVHYAGEPSVQVYTNEPGMGELVGWIESQLVPYMWQCSVVATKGRLRKERFFDFYKTLYTTRTVGEIYNMFTYKFHDFGRRGAANSSITGYAHLINWPGTDTIDSAYMISKMFGMYLGGAAPYRPCSIPAAAHRTITPWATEYEAYDNILKLYGDDLVSIVADSYDYENGLQYLASQSKIVKEKGGLLVVRPDSGDPVDCVIRGLHVLDSKFGSTINEAGLKTLNNSAIIQGDGVDDNMIFDKILPAIVAENFCPSNVAFGMGENNHIAKRSDLETAYKTCAIGHEGDDNYSYLPVMKASNSQFKTSFPCLVSVGGNSLYRVNPIDRQDLLAGKTGDLEVLYSNGNDNMSRYNFEGCVNNAMKQWDSMPAQNINSISPAIIKLQEDYMTGKGSNK